MEPLVSVLIASDRVDTLLPACLRSVEEQADVIPVEALVASGEEPTQPGSRLPVRWIRVPARNPAHRRNEAAKQARGSILAFLDDDATAEPGWLVAGTAAIASAGIVGRAAP